METVGEVLLAVGFFMVLLIALLAMRRQQRLERKLSQQMKETERWKLLAMELEKGAEEVMQKKYDVPWTDIHGVYSRDYPLSKEESKP